MDLDPRCLESGCPHVLLCLTSDDSYILMCRGKRRACRSRRIAATKWGYRHTTIYWYQYWVRGIEAHPDRKRNRGWAPVEGEARPPCFSWRSKRNGSPYAAYELCPDCQGSESQAPGVVAVFVKGGDAVGAPKGL